jgi:hypothetical protein
MARRRAPVLPLSLVLAAWALSAAALDRDGAIEAAKRQVKTKCTSATPCTFTAKAEKDKWYVRVEYPGGHAIFIFDQTGKVVGRVEGK